MVCCFHLCLDSLIQIFKVYLIHIFVLFGSIIKQIVSFLINMKQFLLNFLDIYGNLRLHFFKHLLSIFLVLILHEIPIIFVFIAQKIIS